jgi:hypothetical protein
MLDNILQMCIRPTKGVFVSISPNDNAPETRMISSGA